MPTSIGDFEELVLKKKLIVENNRALTSAVLNSMTIADGSANRKLNKEQVIREDRSLCRCYLCDRRSNTTQDEPAK